MTVAELIEIAQDLLYTALLLALPALAASLIVGLIISILQTLTSIQEQTLSFAPKIIAVALVLVFTIAWTSQLAIQFTVRMIAHAAEVTR
jgi:flagellar biosynthetic protein FliQ